jgi:hypothetical protein
LLRGRFIGHPLAYARGTVPTFSSSDLDCAAENASGYGMSAHTADGDLQIGLM